MRSKLMYLVFASMLAGSACAQDAASTGSTGAAVTGGTVPLTGLSNVTAIPGATPSLPLDAGEAAARQSAGNRYQYPTQAQVSIAINREKLSDEAVDTPPVIVAVSGTVRDTQGRPVPGAVVELVMNPYKPSGSSAGASTVVDEHGEFLVIGQGHHGSALVKCTLGGVLIGLQTYWSIRKDQRFRTSFRLQTDSEGRIRLPNLLGPPPRKKPGEQS